MAWRSVLLAIDRGVLVPGIAGSESPHEFRNSRSRLNLKMGPRQEFQLVVTTNSRSRIFRYRSSKAALADFHFYSQLARLSANERILKVRLVGSDGVLREKIFDSNS